MQLQHGSMHRSAGRSETMVSAFQHTQRGLIGQMLSPAMLV